ncbi:MAG: O-antigen ligase family protein [Oscillospiraceae bacterium]|nr:O-antigen ligase family protein [Oscillospiraceae bacterium]
MPKTAKTIFGTTEKSNFILNMTPESYYQYNLKILLGFLILMPLFCIPLEFFKVYSVPGMALSIAGVFAIVFVFIGFMKSETPKKLFLPACLLGGMLIWGLVSFYNSYDYLISIFGDDGRSEGWLSMLFYGGFFLLGAQLGTDDNRLKLLHGMLWLGLAECFWSLLQMLPLGFPSYYKSLEPMLIFNVYLPSGLTGSPISLGVMLSVLLIPALLEAVSTENPKRKLLNYICIFCFSLTAIRTQCLAGVIGIILAFVIWLICILIKKSGKKAVSCLVIALIGMILGTVWNYVSPSLNGMYTSISGETSVSDGIYFYDGGVMWEDSSYRLETSGYYVRNASDNPNGTFDIENISDVYHYLWSSTLKIIKSYPLAGSGQDNLVYPQIYQSLIVTANPNTFDRCGNYYLQIAGTMGIPMLLLFLAVAVLTAVRGGIAVRKEDNWLHTGIFCTVLLYLILMFISTGSITVTPLFWMLAGICISLHEPENSSVM